MIDVALRSAARLRLSASLTSLCSLRKQLLCDFEIIRGSMANSKDDVSSKEWPMFLPVPEALMRKVFSIYALEERQALPHKERGNELYRARRFEEALEEYTKALHCFSIRLVALDKMANGFLLGTISTGCGADSCVQILGGAASPLARRIVSFLVAQPYFFYRLPAIISGNISIVLRALGRRGAWNAAKRSLQLDPTYIKGLSLMQKALADPQNEFPEEIRKGLASTLKVKEQVVMMMTREATEHMGIMAAGLLPCPIDFLILEQSRVYKELETVMSTEAYLDRESPKSVSLSVSLVPCAGADKTTGQWLYTSLSFVNADTRLIPPYELPEITHFHFARADPENGYDVELPPNGKASPRAVAFVLKRVPQVAQILKDRFGLTVKLVRCGQGLVNLTGPNGPDDANEIGIGPGGIPQFLPSIESREEPAREFRQIDLGPESERLWCTWDDFSRDIKVLPAHSTYANEKAAGRDATLGDVPFS